MTDHIPQALERQCKLTVVKHDCKTHREAVLSLYTLKNTQSNLGSDSLQAVIANLLLGCLTHFEQLLDTR